MLIILPSVHKQFVLALNIKQLTRSMCLMLRADFPVDKTNVSLDLVLLVCLQLFNLQCPPQFPICALSGCISFNPHSITSANVWR